MGSEMCIRDSCYTGPDTYGLLTLENGKVTAYEHKEVPKQ